MATKKKKTAKRKDNTLKPRGVRFSDDQWRYLNQEARAYKPRITPSEILRDMVDTRRSRKAA